MSGMEYTDSTQLGHINVLEDMFCVESSKLNTEEKTKLSPSRLVQGVYHPTHERRC